MHGSHEESDCEIQRLEIRRPIWQRWATVLQLILLFCFLGIPACAGSCYIFISIQNYCLTCCCRLVVVLDNCLTSECQTELFTAAEGSEKIREIVVEIWEFPVESATFLARALTQTFVHILFALSFSCLTQIVILSRGYVISILFLQITSEFIILRVF